MLHKAWNSKGEMPYCFPRWSIKFQGHTVQNITDFDPNWAFPDYNNNNNNLYLYSALIQFVSKALYNEVHNMHKKHKSNKKTLLPISKLLISGVIYHGKLG